MQPIQGKPKIAQREIKAVPDAQVSGGRQGGGERLSCDLWAVLGLSLLPGLGQFDDFCCKLEEQETCEGGNLHSSRLRNPFSLSPKSHIHPTSASPGWLGHRLPSHTQMTYSSRNGQGPQPGRYPLLLSFPARVLPAQPCQQPGQAGGHFTLRCRGGKHQIKTASPSSIGVKGSPSLQNSPQLLHKLHPTHFHTSSCRDVPGGLQTWMLYFSAPYFPEKKSILGAPCLWDQWSPKPDRDVTHQAGAVDTAMDVAHQATRSSFLQQLPSLRYLLCPWKSSAGCRDGKGLTQS